HTRLRSGDIPSLSVRLAEAEAALVQQDKLRAELNYRSLCSHLAQLIGWRERPFEPTGTLVMPTSLPSNDALMADARAQDPALRTLAAKLREASAQQVLSDREAWPEPTVG